MTSSSWPAPSSWSSLLAQTDVDTEDLADAFEGEGLMASDWLTAGGVLLGSLLIATILQRLVTRSIRSREGTPVAARLLGRLLAYAVVAGGLVYSLSVLGVRIGPLLGALGIIGIALAFALQDIIENFVAGLMLQVRRPFLPGEQVTTGDYEGRVVDVNARSVVLSTPDGERVVVPAGDVLANPIVNLTREGVRRTTLEIGVDYDTDLERAREVLLEAAASTGEVRADPPPLAQVVSFGDSTIVLALRFWHEPTIAAMWAARDRMAVAAKAALDEAGISIAFPQLVLHQASTEGQSADRADATVGSEAPTEGNSSKR